MFERKLSSSILQYFFAPRKLIYWYRGPSLYINDNDTIKAQQRNQDNNVAPLTNRYLMLRSKKYKALQLVVAILVALGATSK